MPAMLPLALQLSLLEACLRLIRATLASCLSRLPLHRSRLVSAGTLFTYLDPTLAADGPLPRTNNPIEGGVNARLRDMHRTHRGLSLMRRVKAVFWWCYLHTESPKPARDALASMPTDDDIDFLYRTYSVSPKMGGRRAGVGRQGRLGGAPSRGPVPLLAGLGHVFYRDTLFVL